jgi:hypothetical protein
VYVIICIIIYIYIYSSNILAHFLFVYASLYATLCLSNIWSSVPAGLRGILLVRWLGSSWQEASRRWESNGTHPAVVKTHAILGTYFLLNHVLFFFAYLNSLPEQIWVLQHEWMLPGKHDLSSDRAAQVDGRITLAPPCGAMAFWAANGRTGNGWELECIPEFKDKQAETALVTRNASSPVFAVVHARLWVVLIARGLVAVPSDKTRFQTSTPRWTKVYQKTTVRRI